MILSNDQELLKMLKNLNIGVEEDFEIINTSNDPLDLMSVICSENPSLVVIDDDFLKPHSAHILRSVRKVNSKVKIIFVTSDSSVELGREISPLGIHYYGHKPLEERELRDSINSFRSQLLNISTT